MDTVDGRCRGRLPESERLGNEHITSRIDAMRFTLSFASSQRSSIEHLHFASLAARRVFMHAEPRLPARRINYVMRHKIAEEL